MPRRNSASTGTSRQPFLFFASLTSRLRGLASSSRTRTTAELKGNSVRSSHACSNGIELHKNKRDDDQCVSNPGTTKGAPIVSAVMHLQAGGEQDTGTSCLHHDTGRVDGCCNVGVTTGRIGLRSNECIRTNKFLLLQPTDSECDTFFPPELHQETAQICKHDVSSRNGDAARAAEKLTLNTLHSGTATVVPGLSWLPQSKALPSESCEGAYQTCSSAASPSRHTESHGAGSETPTPSAPRLPRRAAAAGKLTSRLESPFEEKCRLFLNGKMSASCLAQWGVGTTCRKGLKKGSTNQDDFFVYCCDEWGLYGVFDGHGPGGHFVSNFVQWHLPTIIHDRISACEAVPHALTKSFLRVNAMLKEAAKERNFDSDSSGSTASVVFHLRQESKLFIAHVGDSKIVLATRNKDGKLVAERLTREHRPNDPVEKRRIETCGGEVRRPLGHVPHRVFVKGKNYPGLAMSRSIGDSLGHAAGVIPQPDITERMLVEGIDEYLIMCSDGVWEFISDQEAVDIVSCFPLEHVDRAVAKLSWLAWRRWMDHQRHSVDDITAQVVHMFPSSTLRTSGDPKYYDCIDIAV